MKTLLVRLFVVYCFFFKTSSSSSLFGSFSRSGARQRFEQKFLETCSKYPFVDQYVNSLKYPRKQYVIFVFHETGMGGNGGLGDRLGGMITALAFALRTNRTFLIVGDRAFEDSFQPFQPSLLLTSNNRGVRATGSEEKKKNKEITWANWDWSGWEKSFATNMTFNKQCVNPKPSNIGCALDKDVPEFQVVKFRGNRAYLCRWSIKPSLKLQDDILKTLGIDLS